MRLVILVKIDEVILGLVPLVAQERIQRVQKFLIQPMLSLPALHHFAQTLKGNSKQTLIHKGSIEGILDIFGVLIFLNHITLTMMSLNISHNSEKSSRKRGGSASASYL